MTKLKNNRCANCGGKFGLVSHHHWGLRFCHKACKHNFLAKTAKDYACLIPNPIDQNPWAHWRSPLVPRCAWTGAALGPAAGDLVLLADAGLVGEPDFYRVAVKRLLARNCLQARGEVFLKSSIAPSACAW